MTQGSALLPLIPSMTFLGLVAMASSPCIISVTSCMIYDFTKPSGSAMDLFTNSEMKSNDADQLSRQGLYMRVQRTMDVGHISFVILYDVAVWENVDTLVLYRQ